MKKIEIIYISALFVVFMILAIIDYNTPKALNWETTFHPEHSIPFGGMILKDVLDDYYDDDVVVSNLTTYELLDTLQSEILYVQSYSFWLEESEISALLNWVEEGGNLLLSAEYNSVFDTLGLYVEEQYYYDSLNMVGPFIGYDSLYVYFANPEIESERFWYPVPHASNYFEEIDTANTNIIALNEYDEPVIVEIKIGKGNIVLSLLPMALTNYYLIKPGNIKFADYLFTYLPGKGVHWTEYYQLGRREARSPMRYILKDRSLRSAYYVLLGSFIFFIIFRAKRKQRIIPIMKPLANTSQEFTRTLGNLYMHNGDHKDASEKKINHFFEHLRSQYFLDTNHLDEEFYELLSKKSGKKREVVDYLFKMIAHIQSRNKITKEQLLELNTKIDDFYE